MRIDVVLDRAEMQALVQMASVACRPPRLQLRHILREEARRRGSLGTEASTQEQEGDTRQEEAGHAER